jgi:hypothetical protein
MPVKNSINKGTSYNAVLSSTLNAVTFTPINPAGLSNPCFLLRVNNFSDQIIIISYDGVNNHDQIDTRTSLEVYGGQGSGTPNTSFCLWPIGTIVYARSAAGAGAVSVAGYYQPSLN